MIMHNYTEERLRESYKKIELVYTSCTTHEQLENTHKWATNFLMHFQQNEKLKGFHVKLSRNKEQLQIMHVLNAYALYNKKLYTEQLQKIN